MKRTETLIGGVCVIEPRVFGDSRGWFYESYSLRAFEQIGIDTVFVQDNRSYSSAKGTLRGLHCQVGESAQAKLVSCTRGEILDVAVDIREGSPTYMKHVGVILSAENKKMLYIPAGCLHGFVALTDDVELSYKVDKFYSAADDRSIRYDDPAFGIDWGATDPVLSDKDRNAPLFACSDARFTYDGEKK